jgi:hypothetical protein
MVCSGPQLNLQRQHCHTDIDTLAGSNSKPYFKFKYKSFGVQLARVAAMVSVTVSQLDKARYSVWHWRLALLPSSSSILFCAKSLNSGSGPQKQFFCFAMAQNRVFMPRACTFARARARKCMVPLLGSLDSRSDSDIVHNTGKHGRRRACYVMVRVGDVRGTGRDPRRTSPAHQPYSAERSYLYA